MGRRAINEEPFLWVKGDWHMLVEHPSSCHETYGWTITKRPAPPIVSPSVSIAGEKVGCQTLHEEPS